MTRTPQYNAEHDLVDPDGFCETPFCIKGKREGQLTVRASVMAGYVGELVGAVTDYVAVFGTAVRQCPACRMRLCKSCWEDSHDIAHFGPLAVRQQGPPSFYHFGRPSCGSPWGEVVPIWIAIDSRHPDEPMCSNVKHWWRMGTVDANTLCNCGKRQWKSLTPGVSL